MDRLEVGPWFLGKFGDLVGCPGSPTGHSADGLVEVAAAIRLNLGSDLGVKNGGEWRFFEGQKRHLSVPGTGVSNHKPLSLLLLCRTTFLAPESKKNVGRHFRATAFFDVTQIAVYALTALDTFDLRQTRRGRPDGDVAVALYVPLLPASWPNGLAQCARWLPIELPGNSGGLLVRCRSMAPRA